MSHLLLNLLLALVWMMMTGDLSTGNLALGFAIGFVAIGFSRPVLRSQRYVRAVTGAAWLVVAFARELVLANLQMARDVLRRAPPFEPGFIAFDIRDLDRTETVVLANLVSLTPGSICVELDDQGETLYVHSLYAGDPDAARSGLRRLANLVHGALGERPS